MTTTRISDLIVPENYSRFERDVVQRSIETNLLYQSGIVVPDQRLDELAKSPGKTFNMPFFNDLGDDESNVGSDNPDSSSTPKKIGTDKDVSVKHVRNQSWSSADINLTMIGVDPMDVILNLVSGYWNRQMQRILIASLSGVLADNIANDAGDMVYNICTEVSGDAILDSNCISGDAVVMSKQTMGDQSMSLVAIAMHSTVFSRLQKQNLISTVRNSEGKIMFHKYLELIVIVDDRCPAVTNETTGKIEYTTYLFGQGAVGIGNGQAKVPIEVKRDPDAGDGEGIETLYSRKHFILHPRGVAFQNSSVAGISPTNAELEEAANWDRVYNRKNIRIAVLKTNG